HEDAMRAGKQTLAPGAQEIAIAVEHDHRVFAAIEHIDVVVAIDADRADLLERPAWRQLRPVHHRLVGVFAVADCGHGVSLPSCGTLRPASHEVRPATSPAPIGLAPPMARDRVRQTPTPGRSSYAAIVPARVRRAGRRLCRVLRRARGKHHRDALWLGVLWRALRGSDGKGLLPRARRRYHRHSDI